MRPDPRWRGHNRPSFVAAMLIATAALSACGAGTTGSTATQTGSPATQTGSPATSARASTAPSSPVRRPAHRSRRRPKPPTPAPAGSLAYSTASNDVVQPQPPPGSCHAIGSGTDSRPDPRCTPGALNPAVTQATIGQTICVRGWTATVRPPQSVTEPEKAASVAAYGDTGSLSDYEYDHFVPLELGGATNDPRNLWPQPGGSPNPKDAVESALRRQVCDGRLSLARAQHEIVTNWAVLAHT